MTPLVAPPEVRLVLTREAAEILGCSMARVRSSADAGLVKSWCLGPKTFAYDIEEIKRYRDETEAARRAGEKVAFPVPLRSRRGGEFTCPAKPS
jgi:hypothetical protein